MSGVVSPHRIDLGLASAAEVQLEHSFVIVDDLGDAVIETDNTLSSTTTGFRLSLDLGSAIDKVIASINYALGNFLENLDLAGQANLTGSGNELANFLTGNTGNNTMNGLGGNDTILGGLGYSPEQIAQLRTRFVV